MVERWWARLSDRLPALWHDGAHLLPVAIAVIYLIVLFGEFRYLVTATNWDSDSASSSVIAQTLGTQPHHPSVALGQFGWYVTLWFDLATKWLPGHRQIWQAAPYGVALAEFALISWASLRVGGRRAAAITAAVLICASPPVLANIFSPTLHVSTWFGVGVLVASLVFVIERGQSLKRPRVLAVVLVSGGVAGACAASDPLLWLVGIAPLLAATAAVGLRARGPTAQRLIAATGLTLGAAIIVAVAAEAIMRGQGFVVPTPSIRFAGIDEIRRNAVLVVQVVFSLGNGYFPAKPIDARGLLTVVCAVVALAGVTAPLVLLRRVLHTPPVPSAPGRRVVLLAFGSYWAAVVVLLIAALVFSNMPVDLAATKYAIPFVFAAAAAAPLLVEGSPRKQTILVAAVTAFAVANLISLVNRRVVEPAFGVRLHQTEIVHFLEREKLSVGYGGYWDASNFTWQSRLRFQVYPVWECVGQPTLCPFFFHSISTWYQPRPNRRTFLIVDPPSGWVTHPPASIFGPPSRVLRAGEVAVYVFPYDIASRFGPRVGPPLPPIPTS